MQKKHDESWKDTWWLIRPNQEANVSASLFPMPSFSIVHTKMQPWSLQTKTESAAFPKPSILRVWKLQSRNSFSISQAITLSLSMDLTSSK